MKKLLILSVLVLFFYQLQAVVIIATDAASLTKREHVVVTLLADFGITPEIRGPAPVLSDLQTYNLIIATETVSLSAEFINDLIDAGKKVLLLYNAGTPLGGTWTTDNVLNNQNLIIENDNEVFNGYQSNLLIRMQSGIPTCYVKGNLPPGWTVAGSNYYSANKTILYRTSQSGNGKGLVFTYNPEHYLGVAKNFFALAYQWLTGSAPFDGIDIPEGNTAMVIRNYTFSNTDDLTASEANHYNRLVDQGFKVTCVPFSRLDKTDLSKARLVTAVEYPSIDRNTINEQFDAGKKLLLLKTSAATVGGTWDINNVINNQKLIIEDNAALFDGYKTNIDFRAETKNNSASITSMYPAGWSIIGRTYYAANKTVLFKENQALGAKALIVAYDPANYTEMMKNFADRAIEWIEDNPPYEGVVVPAGNVAFIISGYDDGNPPELTPSENTHYNTLVSQGYDVTFIRSGRLSNSDLSAARLVTAVEYPSIDKYTISYLLEEGHNILLLKTSAAPIGGAWDINNVINNQRLIAEKSEAILKGFVSNLNFRAETRASSASIVADYPPGWNMIGHTYYEKNKTVLYKEDTQSSGKALVITYDPANFSESMKNFSDIAYQYLEGESPFESVIIPDGNVAFVITRYNDSGMPDLTESENNYHNFLVNEGFQVSFLRFSRIFNADFSEARFVTGVEFPSLNLGVIEQQLIDGKNVMATFTSGSVVGGRWGSLNNPSFRNLWVEENTCFFHEYEIDQTLAVQQTGEGFAIQENYPEDWKIIGRNTANIANKTTLVKTSTSARAIVFSYNSGMLAMDGTDLLKSLIDYFNQPIETAVEGKELALVSVYPIPARTILTVRSPLPLRQISLYDMAGRVILIEKAYQSVVTISINHLKSGVYICRIETDEGIIMKKVAIQQY